MKKQIIGLFISSLILPIAHAKHHEHGHEHEQHDKKQNHDHEHKHNHDEKVEHIGPHVHGVASLNVALDGNVLAVSLETPAINVFGFEHEPKTKQQKNIVEKAEHTLEKPNRLFSIKGGHCHIKKTQVKIPFDAHEEHTHKDKKGEVHSDVDANYQFICKKPAKIRSINVKLFKAFKGFHKLNVQWIANNKQGASVLTKKAPTFYLK